MKKFENDMELREVIKSIQLEKPSSDFTTNVMNKVFQERSVVVQLKEEPVLGKGFWVIIALFVALMVIMVIFSGSDPSAEANALISDINSEGLLIGYRSFFDRLGALPSSIAGISLGFSLLILLERYLTSKKTDLV
ncbi:MAG TPA: hypothetical protein VFD91_00645 [Mariniphaga sp.]|nr:hypothetical protein [Mariniphaga sp.]